MLKTQKGFDKHACEKKQQALLAGEDNLHRVHRLFNYWFYINRFHRTKEGKPFNEFLLSPYFGVFCEFYGSAVKHSIGDKKHFLDWVTTNRIEASKWSNDAIIERYQRHQLLNGDVHDAVTKSLQKIIEWADDKQIDYREFFTAIRIPEALVWLDRGDLSPWIFMLSDRAPELMNRFHDDDLDALMEVIDIEYWTSRVTVSVADAAKVKHILNEIGL